MAETANLSEAVTLGAFFLEAANENHLIEKLQQGFGVKLFDSTLLLRFLLFVLSL